MQGMKGRYLVIIAVAVFLLFMGVNVYQFLCPTRWSIECFVTDSSGKALSSRLSPRLTTEREVKEFIAGPERDGETCTTIPVRECPWDRY
jgi:hypothetical protein